MIYNMRSCWLFSFEMKSSIHVTEFLFPPRVIFPSHHLTLAQQIHSHLLHEFHHHQLGPESGTTLHYPSDAVCTLPKL